MERDIIHIDEELCDGCGDCIPNCHEGALQLIDGKATLISDLMCDGLGACIGHCPQGAITMEKREAEPYDETEVISGMAKKGRNVVLAHLQHLVDHSEFEYVQEGVTWLRSNRELLSFDLDEVTKIIHESKQEMQNNKINIAQMAPEASQAPQAQAEACGCPGSQTREIKQEAAPVSNAAVSQASALRQWPVQFHLVNPAAGYFKGADLLLAADCSAYTMGNFHSEYLRGKSLAIACPKLDSGMEIYVQKLVAMIDEAKINTLQVMIMEVPCCGGLIQMAQMAVNNASRKIPVKKTVVGIHGDIISEDWI